jgi:hypothetical protein
MIEAKHAGPEECHRWATTHAGMVRIGMRRWDILFLLGCALIFGATGAQAAEDTEAIVWQGVEEIAAGRGEKGPWRQNDSRYDYVDDPAVAIDDQGNMAVVWVDQKRKDVLFRRIASGGPRQAMRPNEASAQPINVSRSPATFSWLPRIAFVPGDSKKIRLIWQEIIFSGASHGGEIFFARSENGGQSFEPPVNISNSTGGDGKGRISRDVWHNGSLDMALGPDGSVHAVWTEYDGMLWSAHSFDGGRSFSNPRHIAGSRIKPARAPAIAIGKDGALYLAWTTGESDSADILLARSDDKGVSFGRPQTVAASPGYSDAPKLAVDAKGRLHLAYAESDGDAFGSYHVRYTRSFDGARSFEAPRELFAASLGSGEGAGFPSLAIDGNDTVILSWELYPGKDGRPRGLGYTVSGDGGQWFAPPRVMPGSIDPAGGSNGSYQGLLMKKLAVNGRGTLAVVNSSMKPQAHSRAWLMRGKVAR